MGEMSSENCFVSIIPGRVDGKIYKNPYNWSKQGFPVDFQSTKPVKSRSIKCKDAKDVTAVCPASRFLEKAMEEAFGQIEVGLRSKQSRFWRK